MTGEAKQEIKDRCLCQNCKGIHTVSYRPGACEAVVACQECGRLYYSLLYEKIGNDLINPIGRFQEDKMK